jgi:hypothetical protein
VKNEKVDIIGMIFLQSLIDLAKRTMMIHLEKISEKTFKQVIQMKLAPGQGKHVETNLYSLAQA